jgi:mutator protein MutT
MTERPLIEKDVAVALIMRSDQLLLRERKDNNPLWDHKWEFSGGKFESGETAERAVCREVLEETGLIIESPEFQGVHDVDWNLPDRILRVHLHCFVCAAPSDDVVVEDRSCYGYAWVDPIDALSMDLLEGNAEIIKRFILEK